MIANRADQTNFTSRVKDILSKEPGLSVKELSERLSKHRQFLDGVITVIEERDEVSCRQVGPARIYYVRPGIIGVENENRL